MERVGLRVVLEGLVVLVRPLLVGVLVLEVLPLDLVGVRVLLVEVLPREVPLEVVLVERLPEVDRPRDLLLLVLLF